MSAPDKYRNPAQARTADGTWLAVTLAVLVTLVIAAGVVHVITSRATASVGGAVAGPSPVAIATAKLPVGESTKTGGGADFASAPTPLAGGQYAGSLVLNDTGSQLAKWNATSSYCPQNTGYIADGTIATGASGAATLSTTSTPGSCAALISPGAYSSAVIEAEIDFPALPGKSQSMANWAAFWLTNGPAWPTDGELDAAEVEPVDDVNAVTWHSGTTESLFSISTDLSESLPIEGADLTPGWHTVDVVYTKGFFEIFYDGHEYTSYTSYNVTGSALNIYFTMINTPDTSYIRGQIGGPPVNSDSSAATLAVKYVRVWSYR